MIRNSNLGNKALKRQFFPKRLEWHQDADIFQFVASRHNGFFHITNITLYDIDSIHLNEIFVKRTLQIMNIMNYFEQFNVEIKAIFKLFKEIPNRGLKSKVHITELQSKMVNGMRTEEKYALNVLGPLVFQAREEIAASDGDFFINRRYDVEVGKLCKDHKINFDNAINCINYMKEAYSTSHADTQTQIFRHLKSLLTIYAQYKMSTANSS